VEKPGGKRPLGKPGRGWEKYIKMGLREIGWDGTIWSHLAQNRDQWQVLVDTLMNPRVP
jgi:hypothetical protein